jgi:phospholipid transport system substrate-binding protein
MPIARKYQKDSAKLDQLVSRLLMPHFDINYAARLVLAHHWSAATPEQRRRFTDAFYQTVLHSYSAELVGFSLNDLQVLPYSGCAAATYASVDTLVHRRSGSRVNVEYSLHHTAGLEGL